MAWYSGRILEPASTFSNVGQEDMLLFASKEAHQHNIWPNTVLRPQNMWPQSCFVPQNICHTVAV